MSEPLQVSFPAPLQDEPKLEFRTSCEKCVFASWNGSEQTGCRLGRLAMLRQAGAVIEQVESDDGLRYQEMKGRICFAHRHRDSDWAKKYLSSEWDVAIQDELKIQFRAVVLVSETTRSDEIESTLGSLVWQTAQPAHVSLAIAHHSPLSVPRASRLLQRKDMRWTWNVSRREEPGTWGEDVDEAVNNCKQGWYAIFKAGFIVPKTFFSEIQSALVDRCEKFVLLKSTEEFNGMVVQTRLHRALRGFGVPAELVVPGEEVARPVTNLCDKTESLAMASGHSHMIRDVREVCTCLG